MLFDFEWVNHHFFDNVYKRIEDYWAGSILSSVGKPTSAEERALLAPYPDAVLPEFMDGSWRMPMIQVWSEKSLRKPGNFYKKQVLLEKITKAIASNSLPLQFEIMTQTPNEEKVALAFQNSLSRLGIDVEIRTVDDTQYQNRLGTFDYDMIIEN